MEKKKEILPSYYTIRKTIGILGILLPIIILLPEGQLLASISHYYYTKSAVFFIAIMTSFALFLISYRGYKRDEKTEILSDNVITHIAGFAALIVVLVPTSCTQSGSEIIEAACNSGKTQLFGHNNTVYSTIHLLSAGIFLFAMGWMSRFRFTKGTSPYKWIFKWAAYVLWASIAILLVEFIIKWHLTIYDVYILETISVLAFGISWLVKGKAIQDLTTLRTRAQ